MNELLCKFFEIKCDLRFTNTSTFDVPGNNVAQNQFFDVLPGAAGSYPSGVAPSGTHARRILAVQPPLPAIIYSCATGLGVVTHTIGSPRQVQMSLQLAFQTTIYDIRKRGHMRLASVVNISAALVTET